ncbi:MAG: uracil-DNA glycosylase [Gammaproteobacteria bacterium]|nr:uracil-DNA glycosylase [Gammaproteobacteria bacterium]
MLSPRQQHCLKAIGIRRWVERASVTESAAIAPAPLTTESPAIVTASPAIEEPALPPATLDISLDSWDAVNHSIQRCEACQLTSNCTQKVPGVGDQKSDLMIIGEGPGHDEDIKGEPFVGRSGQLLDKMLAAIGLSRSQVFITNIVKCRPPNNRDPHVDEVQACNRFLRAQIDLIKPKVILSSGRISAHSLLNTTQPVGRLIETMHQLPDSQIPVKVTYHPAYLLRNPSAKAIAWQDLKTLYRILHS